MVTTETARPILEQAWRNVVGREPTLTELQAVQATCRLETGYGTGWKTAEGQAAHNWGAMQAGAPKNGVCPVGSFGYADSHASGARYAACFRAYPDDLAGASDVVRWFFRHPASFAALSSGSSQALASAMLDDHYYEGHGATRADRVAGRVKLFQANAAAIAKRLNEPLKWSVAGTKTGSLDLLLPLAFTFAKLVLK